MAQPGTRIRRGDTVRIITGKHIGKEGKVLRAIAPVTGPKKPRPARVVVEGVNTVIKHQKARPQQNMTPAAQQQQSGRIEIDAPIYACKVMLVCPNCGKTTRVAMGKTPSGERYRECKKCSKRID